MTDTWIQITTEPLSGVNKIQYVRILIDSFTDIRSGVMGPTDAEDLEVLRTKMQAKLSLVSDAGDRAWLTALLPVLIDIHQQGWILKYEHNHIWGDRPESGASREALRAKLIARRDQQLMEPSVRKFIQGMEQWKLYRGRRISIFSLLADGRQIADMFAKDNNRIRPYLEFVTSTARCDFTGLRLQDIWRYIRHTWTNPYESIPGRSLQIIVRDAAIEGHPVIGIAALSSAAVSLGVRDRFIGWDTVDVVSKLIQDKTSNALLWAQSVIEKAIDEIYCSDFIQEGLLPSSKHYWTREHAQSLTSVATQARASHHRLMEGADYKSAELSQQYGGVDWERQAKMPLFRAKRALDLANAIELKNAVLAFLEPCDGKSALMTLKEMFAKVVRVARSKTVGTEIADLTVCGAVAPYSHLAAGKLVAMLATSPDAVAEYKRRYANVAGIIASSMAGRPISRPANLCFVGTTSLYGKRPNQYDRLNMPASIVGGSATQAIRFHHVHDSGARKTKGVGTFQFASQTIKELENYAVAQKGGWKVNNVFGEGTSPKLRGLRTGLELLGLNAMELLVHGIEKCIYGVLLASNADRYLLGLDSQPTWLFCKDSSVQYCNSIADWWAQRWARGRFANQAVKLCLQRETLVYPIQHSARVQLPPIDSGQSELFI